MTIFYIGRTGVTGEAELRQSHQGFWRDYFGPAQVTFEDQPAMAGYAVASLAAEPSMEQLAAYERELLRHASERVRRERDAVAALRLALEEERSELDARRSEFEQQRRRFDARVARFEAQVTESAHSADIPATEAAGRGSWLDGLDS